MTLPDLYWDSPNGLPPGALSIMKAAEGVFFERGFHGTTLRELARAANVSQPLLYHYFASKHNLLVALCQGAVNTLIASMDEALSTCPSDPGLRLDALVTAHVTCEIRIRKSSFVANTEVRSLAQDARRAFEAKRAHVQDWYDRTVLDGAEQGLFRTPYPHETSRAIASMCIAVSAWYREDGPLSPVEIARRYTTLARLAVGAS